MMRRRSSPARGLAWAGLALLGLAAGLLLAAGLALPRLVEATPAAGAAAVSTRARLRLTFDRPMAAGSVEAGLRLEPAVPGDFAWDEAGQSLTFTPRQSWPAASVVSVRLTAGVSRLGLPLLDQPQWTFTVGEARLAFLTAAAPVNLAGLSVADGAVPVPLTAEPEGVAEFAVRADGGLLAYAAWRADGGADLRAVGPEGGDARLVLACPEAACRAPDFAPDGGRLAYERQRQLAGAAGYGDPRVHVLDLTTGQDMAVGEPGRPARAPRWLPDGRLSFYDPEREAVAVLNLANGAATYIPSTSGEPGTFAPDGRVYVFPEIIFQDDALTLSEAPVVTDGVTVTVAGFYSHLFQVDIATNAVRDLSGGGVVEDASPVYSQDGAWLAFGRKPLLGADWQPGRQLWLMRADGADARPLTTAPEYQHHAFAWSPDGQSLIYLRVNATDPMEPAEIWLIRADGTGARRLVSGAYSPEWLP